MKTEIWEEKWNKFASEQPVDEKLLGSKKDIRKYAGIPGQEDYTGYDLEGTDPEFIYSNLPDKLYSGHLLNWESFCSIRDQGFGKRTRFSNFPGYRTDGFWFVVDPEGAYDSLHVNNYDKGNVVVRVVIPKTALNPKCTFWDGEGGGDESLWNEKDPFDTDEAAYWYKGIIPMDSCDFQIVAPTKSKGKRLTPQTTKEEFKFLAK